MLLVAVHLHTHSWKLFKQRGMIKEGILECKEERKNIVSKNMDDYNSLFFFFNFPVWWLNRKMNSVWCDSKSEEIFEAIILPYIEHKKM